LVAWDELKEEVGVELKQLEQLLASHRELLLRCRSATPDNVELSALAAVLHAFYTGIENIFQRVAVRIDGGKPAADTWHKELLESMATPAGSRGPVVSPSLKEQLTQYLTFRHVFRHSYTFQLRWQKMKHLVLNLEGTFDCLQREITGFLNRPRAER